MEAEDVVEVALIDVHVLIFFIQLEVFQQFDVDLHTFLDAVVGNGPAANHAVAHLPLLDSHDEVLRTLSNSLLQVLQDLCGVLAEVDIDSLGLRLQDAVFVYQYEAHRSESNIDYQSILSHFDQHPFIAIEIIKTIVSRST